MRILHTSDWHLGHTLHNQSREYEHREFLKWLLGLIGQEEVDALLVAGDIFDTANPPVAALSMWYDFLARAHQAYPGLDIVAVGGNHDSPSRLDAPQPLLDAMKVRVVGGLLDSDASTRARRTLLPLANRHGKVAAWVAAVPFLRPSDLPCGDDLPQGEDRLVAGVRRVYAHLLEEARNRRTDGEALIATGHCYLTGTQLCELSERRILGGNQHALPLDVFGEDWAYVALGHLHKPQEVGGESHIRYSGAPLPLALDEDPYPHQVVLVDLEGARARDIRTVRVPRAVAIMRLVVDVEKMEKQLARLEPLGDRSADDPTRPLLEVTIEGQGLHTQIRNKLEESLRDRWPRLVSWKRVGGGTDAPLASRCPGRSLRDLTLDEVFRMRWERDNEAPPPEPLLEAFHDLVSDVQEVAS